jgi:hypothetical protein
MMVRSLECTPDADDEGASEGDADASFGQAAGIASRLWASGGDCVASRPRGGGQHKGERGRRRGLRHGGGQATGIASRHGLAGVSNTRVSEGGGGDCVAEVGNTRGTRVGWQNRGVWTPTIGSYRVVQIVYHLFFYLSRFILKIN